MNIANIIGNRIREKRLKQGKSMKDLAHDSDMEYMQLSRIELGKINTSVLQLNKICESLGITLKELFDGIDNHFDKNEK
jgi:transcriptional regulator with XRE-family HTH domain